MAYDLNVDLSTLGVTVTPGTVGIWGSVGPFQNSSGHLYLFLPESAATRRVLALRSTDGGQTWAEVDGANRPTAVVGGIACAQEGDDIHIATLTSTGVLRYHRFNMSTVAWAETGTAISTPFNSGVNIAVRSDGNLVLFYSIAQTVKGTDYESLSYSKRVGSTWTHNIQIYAGSSTTRYTPLPGGCVAASSGRVHLFYRNLSTMHIPDEQHTTFHLCLRSAYTVSAQSTIAAWFSNDNPSPFMPRYFIDGSTPTVAVAQAETTQTSGDPVASDPVVYYATDADSPTFSNTTLTGTSGFEHQAFLFFDPDTDKWYVVSLGSSRIASGDPAEWLSKPSGGSWSLVGDFDSDLLLYHSGEVVARTGYDNATVFGSVIDLNPGNVPRYRDYILVAGTPTTGGWSVGKIRIA